MKVSIIGGGGLVGSCTGFALQAGGIVREIMLLDANAELAGGQALDLAGRVVGNPDRREVVVVQAGQHGDTDHPRAGRRGQAGSSSRTRAPAPAAAPAAPMPPGWGRGPARWR